MNSLKISSYKSKNQIDNAASYSPLDKYKQIKLLGAGAFGQVYLVVDTQLKLPDE